MSIEVKRRYGTTLQHAAFTGAAHEITVDTDKNTAVVHDGTTAGGHPLVTESGTQTLTNKIISVDNNTVSGIAASSFVLSNASGNIDGAASQKVIPTGTVVGTSDTQTLSNKTLTSALVTSTLSDNTATLAIADARFVKGQIAMDSNAKGMSQAVEMTAAASGSTGITVADNSNLDFGTGNFTLIWKGSLPDWTPAATVYLINKGTALTDGYSFRKISGTSYLRFAMQLAGVYTNFDSTAVPDLVDGTAHTLMAVVTRETASAAGSIIFYVDGVQLGNAVAITAGVPTTVDTTAALYVGGTSATREACVCRGAWAMNRAITAAEALDIYRNGISYADKWGSQTALYSSNFSAGADGWAALNGAVAGNIDSIGGENDWLRFTCDTTNSYHIATKSNLFTAYKRYRISGKYYIPSTNSNIDQIRFKTNVGQFSPTAQFLNILDTATSFSFEVTEVVGGVSLWIEAFDGALSSYQDVGGDDVFYVKDIIMTPIGATLALESEGITVANWHDSSANGLNASYPASGSSLTRYPSTVNYFTEARNTTAPNATIPVHSFTALGAETNIDAAFSPKGTGALSAHVADNAATGGNKRGSYAVDFQQTRNTAAQVASGEASVNAGGFSNTSSGRHSVSGGGSLNVVDGEKSTIPGGAYGTTRGLYGRYSYASGIFASNGDAQLGIHIQRLVTTNATASIVTADGAAVSSTNVSVLPDNHAYTAIAYITARDTSTGDMASFKIEGSVKRGANAAATALVGTPTVTTIAADAGASTWAVALVANTTRGSVEVQVTGEAATTIHWVCKLDTVEVG